MPGFDALLAEAERRLVESLQLSAITLDAELAQASGDFRGAPVTLEARAYRGDRIRFARFVSLRGGPLDIANLLVVPSPGMGLPILGADLVDVGRDAAIAAADLTPTDGAKRADPLLARLREDLPTLPSAGELPSWAAEWFSPDALFVRVTPGDVPVLARQLDAMVGRFVAQVGEAGQGGEAVAERDRAARYLAAHRTDDKGLLLLNRIFGEAWGIRFLETVLFPSM